MAPAPTEGRPDTASDAPSSTGLAALAALSPPIGLVGALVLLPVALRGVRPLLRMVQQASIGSATSVLAAALLGCLVAATALALAARGRRVPLALALGGAALPWLAGAVATWLGMRQIARALESVELDASLRASLLAQGLAEVLGARSLGATLGAGLLGGTAIGLALGALGQRAPGRSPLGGALGGAAALPAFGLALYCALPLGGLFGALPTLPLVLAALALVAAGAGGGLAVGRAELASRSAALAAGATLAGALAVHAGAAATEALTTAEVGAALGQIEPGHRLELLARSGLADLAGAAALARWTALLPLLAVGVYAAERSRPGVMLLIGAAAACAIGGVAAGGDRLALAAAPGGEGGGRAWSSVEGFEPLEAPGRLTRSVDVVVARDRAVPATGGPVALSGGDAALVPLFRRLLDAQGTTPTERGDVGRPTYDDAPTAPRRELPQPGPELSVALDARLGGVALLTVLGAADSAGAHAVHLAGRSGETSDEEADRLAEAVPLFRFALDPTGGCTLQLAPAMRPGVAERDAVLWHGAVTAGGPTRIVPRAGAAGHAPFEVGVTERPRVPPDAGDRPVYLALGPTATARDLARVTCALAAAGLFPVLASRGFPGAPERPASDAAAGVAADGDPRGVLAALGGAGGFGGPAPGGGPRTLRPTVVGRLSPEIVTRVVRRHAFEVRACFQQALRARPGAQGRVEIRFEVAADGSVRSADVHDSTLGHPPTERCIAAAVRRWVFPAPEGGVVVVTQPFLLQ